MGEAEDMQERLLRHRRGHSRQISLHRQLLRPQAVRTRGRLRGKIGPVAEREGMDPSIWLSVLKEIHKSIQPTREPQAAIRCFDGLQERKCVVSSCMPDNRLVAHTLGLLGGLND